MFEVAQRKARMLREWRVWADKICRAVREMFPDAEVYVIGSVARGEAVAASDVDILIVLPEVPERALERAKIVVEIEDRAGLPWDGHPFEFHLATREEAEGWLKRSGKSIKITSETHTNNPSNNESTPKKLEHTNEETNK